MPSTSTITSFYTFSPDTTIYSSQVNDNFSTFRGNLLPVDPNTATAAASMAYDLGSVDHNWRGIYNQYSIMYGNTAGSVPTVPTSTAYGLYFKENGKLYKKTSAGVEAEVGSGAGGSVNLITDGDAEGANIWTAYADVAGTRPVDGTGGSPNVTATISSSSPLVGTNSFVFTKDAANRQGEGIATTFSVDIGYRAKVMQIEFDYIVGSGTFTAGSSSADSDLIAYIYDVTNSALIEPSSIKLLSNSSSISDKYIANFQTSSTGASYRLILHCATTSASAYTIKLDSVRVGPCNYVYGTPISDWKSVSGVNLYGATNGLAYTNQTTTCFERVVGDSVQLRIKTTWSGAPATGTGKYEWSLPSGRTVDNTKINVTSSSTVGHISFIDSGTAFKMNAYPYLTSTTRISVASDGGVDRWDTTTPITWTTSDAIEIVTDLLPIVGMSSSVQMSDGYDGRLITARYYASTGASMGTLSGVFSDVTFNTKETDTAASFNGTTYTIPSSGYYKFSGQIYTSGASTANGLVQTKLLVDGANNFSETITSQSSTVAACGSGYNHGPFFFRAGQTVKLQAASTLTTPSYGNGITQNYIQIEKLQSPQTVSMTSRMSAKYYGSSTSLSTTTTPAKITYNTKDHDDFGSYASGIYTITEPGVYQVSGSIQYLYTSAAGVNVSLNVFKNGSAIKEKQLNQTGITNGDATVEVFDQFAAVSGDTIEIRGHCNGLSPSIFASNARNVFTILKVK